MELRTSLELFKHCSLSIIDILEKEDYDQLDDKFTQRQEILDSISKLSFSKEEISEIVEELEIIEISEKIGKLISHKKEIIKIEMEESRVKKTANNQYNKSSYNDLSIFSKKV